MRRFSPEIALILLVMLLATLATVYGQTRAVPCHDSAHPNAKTRVVCQHPRHELVIQDAVSTCRCRAE